MLGIGSDDKVPRESDAVEILLIEDELTMRRFLRIALRQEGYGLIEASSGREGADLAVRRKPHVVLLDLGLPDMSGLEVIEQVRRASDVPIIVISARDGDAKIDALDAGADDYLSKPFVPRELLARIRVAFRHSVRRAHEEKGRFHFGELEVDFDARRVRVAGDEVHLTPTEYRLLGVLIGSADKVVTHRQLLERVWGPGSVHQIQYLRVFVRQLRKKLERGPDAPRYLVTEPVIGYRFRLS